MKARKTGFNLDEEEALNSVLESESWKVLLKLLAQLQADFERHLIQYPLSEGAEKLLLEKARVEGSSRLISELNKFREMRVKNTQRQLSKP